MTHHADRAFTEGHTCNVTHRDAMLDAQLRKAQADLRRAEDELAVWRGLSPELNALRALRGILLDELNDGAELDIPRLRRALTLSAPLGTTEVAGTLAS